MLNNYRALPFIEKLVMAQTLAGIDQIKILLIAKWLLLLIDILHIPSPEWHQR